MKFWRGMVLGGVVLALAACSNANSFSEMKALNEAKPVGSPFTRATRPRKSCSAGRALRSRCWACAAAYRSLGADMRPA